MTESGSHVTLGHFTTYRAKDRFWELDTDDRRAEAEAWVARLQGASDRVALYLTSTVESGSDVMAWSSHRMGDTAAPGSFFRRRARADAPARDYFRPVHVLWGLTRPSEYSRSARSAQAIDPFEADRAPYLVVYPFTKTAAWYALPPEVRQRLMNEHIGIGKQFRTVGQLLLYSFGLQDQEFVVVYETDDLALFSKLVYDLRSTEARPYTLSDTPLHVGVHVDADAWIETLG